MLLNKFGSPGGASLLRLGVSPSGSLALYTPAAMKLNLYRHLDKLVLKLKKILLKLDELVLRRTQEVIQELDELIREPRKLIISLTGALSVAIHSP